MSLPIRRYLLPWLLVPTLLAGCGPLPGAGPEKAPAPPASQVDRRLIDATTRFSFDLFQTLRAEEPGENLFISPASVSLALSLTYGGARGETAEQMAQALSVSGLTRDELNRENEALQSILANPDGKVQLSIANSLWYMKGHKVHPDFLTLAKQHYRAEVEAVQFGHPDAAQQINQWVSRATREKIPTIIDETDALDRIYLINAIYFNGLWQRPFDPALTRPLPFHLANGTVKDLPMMTQSGFFRHLKGENFQAVALPYGEGRVSMYLFLPDKGVGSETFFRSIGAERWDEWLGQFTEREGSVTLPTVKLEYEAELSRTMKALGMKTAFVPGRADFGGLFEANQEDLYIAAIIHKTYLDMNEKGTEAAAVTGVVVRATSAPAPGTTFQMVVDRPYLIAIRDDQTGAILFLGAIADPT